MGLLQKIFGTFSQKEIARIQPIVNEILAKEEEYRAFTDEELADMTPKLKQRLEDGETLDDILPDAYAVCREAATRVLGMTHFPVQLIGGVVLHKGIIAEMKTGEGKTLVATLPVYLNALAGKGVHVVTVNDYLAKRDSEWMGEVYRFLGLTVGLITHDKNNKQRKEAYLADVTYGTNNEFGFDYLRDNMVPYKENMVQRGHAYAVVDEVDSILVDEARTPLIISGQGDRSTELYTRVDSFVRKLKVKRITETDSKVDYDEDESIVKAGIGYIVDEKQRNATLTALGIRKAEKEFGIENLSDGDNMELSHLINQSIRAHGVMKRDVDYVVRDGGVIIVDEFTGRLMVGRRYSEGLHQAIEAKEGVRVERESRTLATITFQNYFRMYNKLAGMTGTAKTEEDEFVEIYGLQVVEIPPNKEVKREDHPDVVYGTIKAKYNAVANQVAECYEKGQPVLVGTISIDKSEALSKLLKARKIPHEVLNAKHHEKEAAIVSQAGRAGAVTIATNMAGRGTDIMLGGNATIIVQEELVQEGHTDKQARMAQELAQKLQIKHELADLVAEEGKTFEDIIGEEAVLLREDLAAVYKKELEAEQLRAEASHKQLEGEIDRLRKQRTDLIEEGKLDSETREELQEAEENATKDLHAAAERLRNIPEEMKAKGLAKTVDEQFAVLDSYIRKTVGMQKDIAENAKKVREAGGLYIIGTERHESRRIDNQLRGRSGRQGDPGESRFYLSLEDDLIRLFGGERLQGMMDSLKSRMDDDYPIELKLISSQIESAQRRIEGRNFEIRKNVLRFDDVMNSQREIIYGQRQEVLSGEDVSPRIKNMVKESIQNTVNSFCPGDDVDAWNLSALRDHYLGWLTTEGDFKYDDDELEELSQQQIADQLIERAEKIYAEKEEKYGEKLMRDFERFALLQNVDKKWMTHIDAMEELRRGIHLRGYAQRDPVVEYRIEGYEMFDEMVESIREDTAKMLMTVQFVNNKAPQRRQLAKPAKAGGPAAGGAKKPQARRSKKIGRNDPCPCGSGKKYKNCCGK